MTIWSIGSKSRCFELSLSHTNWISRSKLNWPILSVWFNTTMQFKSAIQLYWHWPIQIDANVHLFIDFNVNLCWTQLALSTNEKCALARGETITIKMNLVWLTAKETICQSNDTITANSKTRLSFKSIWTLRPFNKFTQIPRIDLWLVELFLGLSHTLHITKDKITCTDVPTLMLTCRREKNKITLAVCAVNSVVFRLCMCLRFVSIWLTFRNCLIWVLNIMDAFKTKIAKWNWKEFLNWFSLNSF